MIRFNHCHPPVAGLSEVTKRGGGGFPVLMAVSDKELPMIVDGVMPTPNPDSGSYTIANSWARLSTCLFLHTSRILSQNDEGRQGETDSPDHSGRASIEVQPKFTLRNVSKFGGNTRWLSERAASRKTRLRREMEETGWRGPGLVTKSIQLEF